jgi:hypothetical protein
MEIVIGSFKLRLEILLLIVILFWVIFGNLLCSCCRIGKKEGLEMIKQVNDKVLDTAKTIVDKEPTVQPSQSTTQQVVQDNTSETDVSAKEDNKSTKGSKKEGFTNGSEFSKARSETYIMQPSLWAVPNLQYSGNDKNKAIQEILKRPEMPVHEGELNMFANTPFKPECCPNTFSSSTGCACMTVGQYQSLKERVGNNVPYSEY